MQEQPERLTGQPTYFLVLKAGFETLFQPDVSSSWSD